MRSKLVLALAVAASQMGIASSDLPDDLTELSLDALLDIEVTSVSKQAESIANAAASIHVLTGEDIKRSGARSIPEALRLVPGLHVVRLSGQQWGITARGFNGSVADKLEVLIDGRSVYSPLFSGVFWDVQDTYIPDIDRIEVIRGPAATLWGANAVNGVINIVTRSASDTQGTHGYAGGGDEQEQFAGIRHGGTIGEDGHYRVYAKSWRRDALESSNGNENDGMQSTQVGFRSEFQSGDDRITVQGDGFNTELPLKGSPNARDNFHNGANLLGRWEHVISDGANLTAQFYWDHSERTQYGVFAEKRDTWDIDLRHNFSHNRHSIVWGGGYRRSRDKQDNPGTLDFLPPTRTVETSNLFVNDQISLNDKLTLTLSARFEHNEFTHFEAQPSVRFSYQFNERTTFWGAISRALRLPNRLDHDIRIPVGPTFILGSKDFEAEELLSRELGLRTALSEHLSMEGSVFYNAYDNLRGVEPGAPSLIANNYRATTRGLELVSHWSPRDELDVHLGYSYFDIDLHPFAGSGDTNTENAENQAPHNQGWLRWMWTPDSAYTLGGQMRYVDNIDGLLAGADAKPLGSYVELDLRAAWQINSTWELAITGQNLLNEHHAEWGGSSASDAASQSEVQRGVYAEFIWTPSGK